MSKNYTDLQTIIQFFQYKCLYLCKVVNGLNLRLSRGQQRREALVLLYGTSCEPAKKVGQTHSMTIHHTIDPYLTQR